LRIEDIVKLAGVEAVSFGPADLANSLGGKVEAYAQSLYVKTRIVVAAAAYGVDPIDCVFFDLQNLEEFRREASQSKDLGYVGKQVVHPSQITIANEVYSPSKDEVESAKKIVEVYEEASKNKVGALRVDEKLVDAVHYRKAKATLERAKKFSD
jgi:citrate lyase subunit beta/citryl-CoA lyase